MIQVTTQVVSEAIEAALRDIPAAAQTVDRAAVVALYNPRRTRSQILNIAEELRALARTAEDCSARLRTAVGEQ